MRVTPEEIVTLAPNEIAVFPSNTAGRHGKGAAKTALKWGAKYGIGEGLVGQTYAIPTVWCDELGDTRYRLVSMKPEQIKPYVDRFLDFAYSNPRLVFLVMAMGTGLAGLKAEQIAPLFKEALRLDNVALPKVFLDILNS